MRTVQIVLDEALLADLDRHAKQFHMSRSSYIRQSLKKVLESEAIRELEKKELCAYDRLPETREEKGLARAARKSQAKIFAKESW